MNDETSNGPNAPDNDPHIRTGEVDQPGVRNLDYIVVALDGPSDGADFGPGTPATKTSGLQEANWRPIVAS